LFTNFSAEHLDYHVTQKDYFAAKARLFTTLLRASAKRNRTACLHTAEPKGKALYRQMMQLQIPTIGFARRPGRLQEVYARRMEADLSGIRGEVVYDEGSFHMESALLGSFQIPNLLGAIAAARALGLGIDAIREGISRCREIPGRMMRIPNELRINIY